jgi:hypothetical protein
MVYSAGVKKGFDLFCPTCYVDCGKRAVTDEIKPESKAVSSLCIMERRTVTSTSCLVGDVKWPARQRIIAPSFHTGGTPGIVGKSWYQISFPAKSNDFRMPVPVITQTPRPSVTGEGDDMFCFISL